MWYDWAENFPTTNTLTDRQAHTHYYSKGLTGNDKSPHCCYTFTTKLSELSTDKAIINAQISIEIKLLRTSNLQRANATNENS